MPDSPEEQITTGNEPFKGSLPEGIIEDKEKAVDMAYAGKARREAAILMEKVSPKEAARLNADANAIEAQAGEKFDSETEKLNMAMSQIGDLLVRSMEGYAPSPAQFNKSEYPVDRLKQQFYEMFGATQARAEAQPTTTSGPNVYWTEADGFRLFENQDEQHLYLGINKVENNKVA